MKWLLKVIYLKDLEYNFQNTKKEKNARMDAQMGLHKIMVVSTLLQVQNSGYHDARIKRPFEDDKYLLRAVQ